VHLGAVLQCRVRKPIQLIREAIETGRFGRILQADAYMKFYRDQHYYHSDPWRSSRRSGAGVTIQHAFHYIDLLQYLVGPATRVAARMTNLAHRDVDLEDTLHAFVDFGCGASGVVVASTAMFPGTDIRIEINGENGTAIMIGEHIETWKFREEVPGDEVVRAMNRDTHQTAASGPAAFGFADHQVVIERMAEAVLTGTHPAITVEEVRPTLEMALAMYQSAAHGGWVSLPVVNEAGIWQ
jgi:predicted dehydrogenase